MYKFYGHVAQNFHWYRCQQRRPGDSFSVCPEQWEVDKFDNNDAGIAALLQKVKELPKPHVVLEATGNYSMKVVFALCENQVPVSVLNPKQSNGFIKGVLLSTTKTDAKDACALALYGQFNKPKSLSYTKRQDAGNHPIEGVFEAAQKQQVVISNQLHALEFHVKPLPYVQESLRESLALCKRQIQDTEK